MVISTDQINQTKKTNNAEDGDKSAVAQELKKIEQLKKLQQQQMDTKSYDKLLNDAKHLETLGSEKGYQAKLQKDEGIKVLSRLAKDMASLGIDITPKHLKKSTTGKINDELESIFNKTGLKEDKFEVTKEAVKSAQNREEKHQEEERQSDRRSDIKNLLNSVDVQEAVQQYSNAFAQEALQANPEAKEKLEEAKDNLAKKGFSEKDVELLGKSVKRSLDNEFVSKVQDSFIQYIDSPKNAFQLVSSEGANGIFGKVGQEDADQIRDNLSRENIRIFQSGDDKKAKQNESQQKSSDARKMSNSSAKEIARQYSSAYAQYAAASSTEAKEKLDEAQDNLRQNGFSDNDIKLLEKTIQKTVSAEASRDQEELIQQMFTPKSVSQATTETESLNGMFERLNKQNRMEMKETSTKEDAKRLQAGDDKKVKELEAQQEKADISKLADSSGAQDDVQQYSSAYVQFAAVPSQAAKENLDAAQNKLRQRGFSDRDISSLDKVAKKSMNLGSSSEAQDKDAFSSKSDFKMIVASKGLGGIFENNIKEDNDKVDDRSSNDDSKDLRGAEKKDKEHADAKRTKAASNMFDTSIGLKEAVQQYSSAFAQNAVAASPEARQRLDDARDKLKKKGISEKDVISIEKTVKRTLKKDYATEIQGDYMRHMFSPKNTFEFIVTSKQLNNTFDGAIKAEKLSGVSGDPKAVKEQIANVAELSREEVKDFIRDAVESKLMERHISNKNNRNDVKKLVDLGHKVGFNFNDFLKTWESKKFDLGMFVLEVENAYKAQNAGQISIGEVSAGGVNDKNGYEMTKDEERELLINQLRAEYMKKALTGDPFAVFSFAPKIRKLKNGLIKLGLETEVFNKIEKEAKTLARYRTLEMLKGAFIERSTYYDLSGPAYNLLKNKQKGLISNLKNLDVEFSKEEMEMLRDDANRQMHDHTIIELKSAVAILENQDNPTLEAKVPLMIKLIQRLREESGFSHGVGEDLDEVIYRYNNGNIAVKESA
jgi:nitrogen regulatory protein PII